MINIQIVCDSCGKVGAEGQWGVAPAHVMRRVLHDENKWKRGEKADSPKDYCHHCVVNGKTKRIKAIEAMDEEKP